MLYLFMKYVRFLKFVATNYLAVAMATELGNRLIFNFTQVQL